MPGSLKELLKEMAGSKANAVTIPRWVVFFQAALLAVVSTSCFLFGLAAGQLSTPPVVVSNSKVPCQVSGSVVQGGRQKSADVGAVVIFLPADKQPIHRIDPATLHPDNFQPLENRAIEPLAAMGGGICRTDGDGKFQITIDSPIRYVLVVISKGVNAKNEGLLSKSDTAALARYFLPIEALYAGKAINIQTIDCRSRSLELDPVGFE
jgi:hypothetical protein